MKKRLFVIPLVFLFCFTMSCQKEAMEETPPVGVSVEEIKANVQTEINEAWNNKDLSVIDGLYVPEFVYHVPPYPDIVGVDAYKEFIAANHNGYPNLNLTIRGIIIEGNMGAMTWTFEGTHSGETLLLGIPGTGKDVVFTGCAVFHFNEEGKTVETWNYVDFAGLMTQLGFTFTPPESAVMPEEKK